MVSCSNGGMDVDVTADEYQSVSKRARFVRLSSFTFDFAPIVGCGLRDPRFGPRVPIPCAIFVFVRGKGSDLAIEGRVRLKNLLLMHAKKCDGETKRFEDRLKGAIGALDLALFVVSLLIGLIEIYPLWSCNTSQGYNVFAKIVVAFFG